MNREQYREAIKAAGFPTQGSAAAFFRVDVRTGRRWCADGCPPAVAMILRYMLAKKLSPKAFSKFAHDPQ